MKPSDVDRYQRTVAEVVLPDGKSLNQELVREGLAWWYRKYAPGNTTLERLEKEAREDKRGLWVEPNPIPPWVYRKAKRGQSLDFADLIPISPNIAPSVSERGPPGNTVQHSSFSGTLPILGNRRSHIYHRPDCPNYSAISSHNQVPMCPFGQTTC